MSLLQPTAASGLRRWKTTTGALDGTFASNATMGGGGTVVRQRVRSRISLPQAAEHPHLAAMTRVRLGTKLPTQRAATGTRNFTDQGSCEHCEAEHQEP